MTDGLTRRDLDDLKQSLNTLSEDVKRDSLSLVELRSQLAMLHDSFNELAGLVRNGKGTSLSTRLSILETRIDDVCGDVRSLTKVYDRLSNVEHSVQHAEKERSEQLATRKYMIWGMFGVTTGALLPFIFEFIKALVQLVAGNFD